MASRLGGGAFLPVYRRKVISGLLLGSDLRRGLISGRCIVNLLINELACAVGIVFALTYLAICSCR